MTLSSITLYRKILMQFFVAIEVFRPCIKLNYDRSLATSWGCEWHKSGIQALATCFHFLVVPGETCSISKHIISHYQFLLQFLHSSACQDVPCRYSRSSIRFRNPIFTWWLVYLKGLLLMDDPAQKRTSNNGISGSWKANKGFHYFAGFVITQVHFWKQRVKKSMWKRCQLVWVCLSSDFSSSAELWRKLMDWFWIGRARDVLSPVLMIYLYLYLFTKVKTNVWLIRLFMFSFPKG